jgi:hypothetical protein
MSKTQFGQPIKRVSVKAQTEGRPVKHSDGTENKGTKVVVKRAGK